MTGMKLKLAKVLAALLGAAAVSILGLAAVFFVEIGAGLEKPATIALADGKTAEVTDYVAYKDFPRGLARVLELSEAKRLKSDLGRSLSGQHGGWPAPLEPLRAFLLEVVLRLRVPSEKALELYANRVYLGQENGVELFGIGQGSSAYFGKPVAQLGLNEIISLAAIIHNSERNSPYRNPIGFLNGRRRVVSKIIDDGTFTKMELQEATLAPPILKKREPGRH